MGDGAGLLTFAAHDPPATGASGKTVNILGRVSLAGLKYQPSRESVRMPEIDRVSECVVERENPLMRRESSCDELSRELEFGRWVQFGIIADKLSSAACRSYGSVD